MEKNRLYYGDNLAVLREHIKDESVDLIYLDPPFNSRQDYNVLFAERDGTRSASQIMAFEDTWEWNMDAERAYEEIVERGGRVSDAMRAFRTFLGHSDMMAYLAMMAPRLIELHRVLKETGSIYLHCDPTASHYLKILMDAVFSPQHYGTRSSGNAAARIATQSRAASCTAIFTMSSCSIPRARAATWNPDLHTLRSIVHRCVLSAHRAGDGATLSPADLTAARPGGDTDIRVEGSEALQGSILGVLKVQHGASLNVKAASCTRARECPPTSDTWTR